MCNCQAFIVHFDFFVPIFGCELLEEEKSVRILREKVKEGSNFDRIKTRGCRRESNGSVVQVSCVLEDCKGGRGNGLWT